MRPIWSGVIGFGLVNIPVRLYSPAKEEVLDLDFLHKKDKSPIRYARVCKAEEKEIEWKDVERGYKTKRGYVVLTKEDFAKADARKTKAIDIQHFASASEIDTVYFDKPYYLEPDPKARKAYHLLREALERTKKVGVASFVLRQRENLAVIKPYRNVLVLNQLRFAHEMQDPADLDLPLRNAPLTQKELKIAVDLIGRTTEPFKPSAHKDRYIDQLERIIKQKSRGLAPTKHGEEPKPTKVADLMAALEKSLAQSHRAGAK
jgi:DNA end-binding protein Ku